MKSFLKRFALRGLIFCNGGPLIYGIVLFILQLCNVEVLCDGFTIFKAIISTLIMAFLVAGASVVWQEERLGIGFSVLIHGSILYVSYLGLYLINNWIPKDITSIVCFSATFVGTYLLIWLIIFITEKVRAKKLNKQLNN